MLIILLSKLADILTNIVRNYKNEFTCKGRTLEGQNAYVLISYAKKTLLIVDVSNVRFFTFTLKHVA